LSDAVHWSEVIKQFGIFATAFAAVAGAAIALLQYFSFKFTTYRDKAAATRKSLETVVASLASANEVDRLAGAILLRKFFDPKSEVSTKGTPYAADAITVIAAILRSQPTGNFQKLLADGLAFAPSLQGADLQKTNLQNAYLGSRGDAQLDLRQADFFRADLAGASLKGANASGAVFYQARMTDAVLRKADLSGANFFEADLLGASFDGAKLAGASFERARNLSAALSPHIKDNHWDGPEVFTPSPGTARSAAPVVYMSKPGCLDAHQEKIIALVCGWLESQGLTTSTLERMDYPTTSVFSELRRRISGCTGAIVFGFAELRISDGLWRAGTAEEARISGQAWSTPWNQVEASMAAMINLPLLLVAEPDVTNGVFDPALDEHNVFRMTMPPDRLSPNLKSWLAAVRERAIST
jgi:uncharacterized protein YjbI with pentapeptide repeats